VSGFGKIRYLDLFAGCGGLTEGFERAGAFEPVGFVEWDKSAARTLERRLFSRWGVQNADQLVFQTDIRPTSALLESGPGEDRPSLSEVVSRAGGVDLVIGGPPCQAYSVAGRIRDEHGMHLDYRNYLFEAYVDLVKRFEPRAFVFENVPGILSARPGGVSIVERIRESFSDAGYEIIADLKSDAMFDLSEFDVPQRRRRVIIIGVRRSDYDDPTAALQSCYDELRAGRCDSKATVRSAIEDLPVLMPLDPPTKIRGRRRSHSMPESELADHEPRFHNALDIGIFRDLAEDLRSGDGSLNSVERIKQMYKARSGKSAAVHKYYVLRWDEPSNTIPAHLCKDGLRHIHPDPDQARSITVREAARLQGFPDDFAFLGPQTANYKMIGNAVPPPFAERLAQAVSRSLFSRGGSKP
jgi:DNA (cytosine-5)-methyltransferase 1